MDLEVAGGPTIFRVSPSTDTVTAQVDLEPSVVYDIVAGTTGTALAVSVNDDYVDRLDPSTGAVLDRYPVGGRNSCPCMESVATDRRVCVYP